MEACCWIVGVAGRNPGWGGGLSPGNDGAGKYVIYGNKSIAWVQVILPREPEPQKERCTKVWSSFAEQLQTRKVNLQV